MKAVILAGGKGARLAPYTTIFPKPLVPIGERPILEIIVRQLARYRFLRSPHIAELIGRSLDRTNDRLSRLFHAGYLDRPRARPLPRK